MKMDEDPPVDLCDTFQQMDEVLGGIARLEQALRFLAADPVQQLLGLHEVGDAFVDGTAHRLRGLLRHSRRVLHESARHPELLLIHSANEEPDRDGDDQKGGQTEPPGQPDGAGESVRMRLLARETSRTKDPSDGAQFRLLAHRPKPYFCGESTNRRRTNSSSSKSKGFVRYSSAPCSKPTSMSR